MTKIKHIPSDIPIELVFLLAGFGAVEQQALNDYLTTASTPATDATTSALHFDSDIERIKWASVVDVRLSQGATMASAIADADLYIVALRARRGEA